MKTYINEVANEAARILKDYPHLKYYEAIMKAKKILKEKTLRDRHPKRAIRKIFIYNIISRKEKNIHGN